MKTTLLTLSLVAALGPTSVAATEVYKWVDQGGKVHFSDRPVQGNSEKVEVRSATPVVDPALEERRDRSRKLLEEISEERTEKKQKEEQQRQDEIQRKANCAQAKDRLDQYEHAAYIYDKDKGGNRRILSDQEYALTLQKSRDEVKKWCK